MYRFNNVIVISLTSVVIGLMTYTVGFSIEFERVITTIPVSSSVKFPFGIVIDPHGSIVISHDGRAISRIDGDGAAHRISGGASKGFEGDGRPASQAMLFGPGRLAFDRQGNLFVPDIGNHRVRKIAYPSGEITTVAGRGPTGSSEGSFAGDGGAGSEAFLNRPISVAFDPSGAMYIADAGNLRVRKITPGLDGIISGEPDEVIETVAGIGKWGFSRDKKRAVTARITVVDIAIDSVGHLFLADANNNRIRRVDKDTGIITTVVGSGPAGQLAGFSGDRKAAKRARMSSPEGIVFDDEGNLYISDTLNHRVRMVTPGDDRIITGRADEIITTIVGSGTIGTSGGGFEGDGGAALEARLNRPQDVAIDAEGNLIIVDGFNHRLRQVTLKMGRGMPIEAPIQRHGYFSTTKQES